MRKLLICIAVLFALAIPAFAQDSVTFAWDLSASEPLGAAGGYKIYASKQSGTYTPSDVIATVPAGTTEVTVDTSAYRGRYYTVATAYVIDNGEEIESGYSNEVTYVIKPHPPTNLRD